MPNTESLPNFLEVPLPSEGLPPDVLAGGLALLQRPEDLVVFLSGEDCILSVHVPHRVVVPLIPRDEKDIPKLQQSLLDCAREHGELVPFQGHDGVLFRAEGKVGLAAYVRVNP